MPRRSSSTSNANQEAGPSRSPTSPISPKTGTRPASTYQPAPDVYQYDPRTPSLHRRSLGRVDESPDLDISPRNIQDIEGQTQEKPGHRGSLVARDYVDGPGTYPYASSPQSMTVSNANTGMMEQGGSGSGSGLDDGSGGFSHTQGDGQDDLQNESGDGDEDGELELDSDRPPSMTTAPSVRRERVDSVDHPFPPNLIPPPSIHDTYLSQYIQPIVPTSSTRPTAPRSTSVPVLTNLDLSTSATTDKGKGLLPPVNLRDEGGHQHPHRRPALGLGGAKSLNGSGPKAVFEIFDTEPGAGSKGLVSALKGHLENVLKIQEEIGRMHFALEGLDGGSKNMHKGQGQERRSKAGAGPSAKAGTGTDTGMQEDEEVEVDDSLSRREKGVEALMERLGQLSDTLRTYHELDEDGNGK